MPRNKPWLHRSICNPLFCPKLLVFHVLPLVPFRRAPGSVRPFVVSPLTRFASGFAPEGRRNPWSGDQRCSAYDAHLRRSAPSALPRAPREFVRRRTPSDGRRDCRTSRPPSGLLSFFAKGKAPQKRGKVLSSRVPKYDWEGRLGDDIQLNAGGGKTIFGGISKEPWFQGMELVVATWYLKRLYRWELGWIVFGAVLAGGRVGTIGSRRFLNLNSLC